MITISLCMIVKNEEKVLSRCLNSVKELVDEIVIIDTGSSDKTKDIALNYTSQVFDFKWTYNFSEARNYSFSKASMDYIMWLDADDLILDEDKEKFIMLKQSISHETDAVIMNYNTWVDENNNVITTIKRERLIKRAKQFMWIEPVHEIIKISGNIINSDICITHKPQHENSLRNIEIYERALSRGEELSPRSTFFYAEQLFYEQRFDECMFYFYKLLDFENQQKSYYVTACQRLSTCYRIKNDIASSIRELFRSFEYDTPQPYICCQLGDIFKKMQDFVKAIFWYELAISIKTTQTNNGLLANQLLNYNPCLNLVYCYTQIGDQEKAGYYKKKAEKFKPPPVVFYK